jgi:metallophosphoesterase superfamily enzyme
MRVIIDRFEGDYAVCEREDRKMINIEKRRLPEGVKEGDALIINGDVIKIERQETNQKKEEIKKLMDELWK